MTTRPDGPAPALRHEALFYLGADDLVERLEGFVRGGLEAGETTLVVLRSGPLERLRSALPHATAGQVLYADMAEVGRNPARIIPAWRSFVDDHPGPLRGVGEPIWSGRSPDELVESERHEALLNLALAEADLWLVCPYDTRSLPAAVLEEAAINHPLLWEGARHRRSDGYAGLDDVARPFDRALPQPAGSVSELPFGPDDVPAVRRFVDARVHELGLPPGRAQDLVLAASEVATNSLRHGGGRGVVRVWRHGESVACEVRDAGRFDRPLAGRERPRIEQRSGYGLWLANQLCDLVQIRSWESGSVVRLLVSLRPS